MSIDRVSEFERHAVPAIHAPQEGHLEVVNSGSVSEIISLITEEPAEVAVMVLVACSANKSAQYGNIGQPLGKQQKLQSTGAQRNFFEELL